MAEPTEIQNVTDQPLNRLALAINHYILIADHFGEAIGIPEPGGMRVLVSVNRGLPQDIRNFEALQARLGELEGRLQFRMEFMGDEGSMAFWGLIVPEGEMDKLTDALLNAPGPLGWGSPRPSVVR